LTFCENQENFATRKKALYHKYFMPFLTRLVLSAAVSKNRVGDNGRDTPQSGRHREDFLRPLGGFHGIDVLVW
jgi:hypothetical protein